MLIVKFCSLLNYACYFLVGSLIDYLGFIAVAGLVLVWGQGKDVVVVGAGDFGGAKTVIVGLFVSADI